jgi:hypothetical protein
MSHQASHNRIALGRDALEDARKAAFELFCIAGTTFPAEWCGYLPNLLIQRAIYFAISARRVHEIMKINPSDIGEIQSFIAPNARDLKLEANYRLSLMGLIHSKSASIVIANTTKKLFTQNENKCVGGIDVEDESGFMRRVNVYGLAVDFLIRVVPLGAKWITDARARIAGDPPTALDKRHEGNIRSRDDNGHAL